MRPGVKKASEMQPAAVRLSSYRARMGRTFALHLFAARMLCSNGSIPSTERGRAMKVSELMTPGVITATPEDTVETVIGRMVMRHCGAIPVVDARGDLTGIVTLRDVLLPLYPNYGEYIHDAVHARDFEAMEDGYLKLLEMKARDVMTPDPMSVSPEDPVLKAASYMGLKNLRRIPVTEGRRLVGIISIGDISRGLFLRHH
jgi:CBS domain-containing protein